MLSHVAVIDICAKKRTEKPLKRSSTNHWKWAIQAQNPLQRDSCVHIVIEMQLLARVMNGSVKSINRNFSGSGTVEVRTRETVVPASVCSIPIAWIRAQLMLYEIQTLIIHDGLKVLMNHLRSYYE